MCVQCFPLSVFERGCEWQPTAPLCFVSAATILQGYITDADYDGSGTIEVERFRDIVNKQQEKPEPTAAELERAFNVFDKDGNGSIPTEELKHMITKLGGQSIQKDWSRVRETVCVCVSE